MPLCIRADYVSDNRELPAATSISPCLTFILTDHVKRVLNLCSISYSLLATALPRASVQSL